jgi:hypothetical protein
MNPSFWTQFTRRYQKHGPVHCHFHQFSLPRDSAQRKPIRNALSEGSNVGNDVVVLLGTSSGDVEAGLALASWIGPLRQFILAHPL